MEACLRRLDKIYRAWNRRAVSDERTLRGVGLGAMFYGIGNTGVSNPSSAQLELSPKGYLTLFTGAAEIGQGSDTILGQIAARYFGLSLDQIRLVRGDTARTTSTGATSASRQTYFSGNAVLEAAQRLEQCLREEGARELALPPIRTSIDRRPNCRTTRDGPWIFSKSPPGWPFKEKSPEERAVLIRR